MMKMIFRCAMFLIYIYSGSVNAKDIFVKQSATGSNNGTSWSDAYTSFQSALNEAVADDRILVAKGKYTPHASDRNISFNIKDKVKIYGGFAGTEMDFTFAALTTRNFVANETILSGDLNNDDTNSSFSDNSYHVVRFSADASASITIFTELDGFTISGGNANGLSTENSGGGILMTSLAAYKTNNPILRNLVIKDNKAVNGGGLAVMSSGIQAGVTYEPLIETVTFSNNIAENQGGAIYNYIGQQTSESNLVIKNCKFLNNKVTSEGLTVYGGAVANYTQSGTIKTIYDQVGFVMNEAPMGGAISNRNYYGTCTPEYKNCYFFGNKARIHGGAIMSYSESGGNITYKLVNSTLVNNQAVNFGNHLYSLSTGSATTTANLTNVIIRGTTTHNIYNSASTTNIEYSIIDGLYPNSTWNQAYGVDGGNNKEINPLFIDEQNYDVRLSWNSPAALQGKPGIGTNIGYFQGGVPSINVVTENLALTFEEIINKHSEQKSFTFSATGLLTNLEIVVHTEFQISSVSNDFSSATNKLTLSQSQGNVASTEVYVRFSPTSVGLVESNVLFNGLGLQYAVPISGNGLNITSILPENGNQVKVYPVPSHSGIINIKNENGLLIKRYEIVNINGAMLKFGKLNTDQETIQINLPSGAYLKKWFCSKRNIKLE